MKFKKKTISIPFRSISITSLIFESNFYFTSVDLNILISPMCQKLIIFSKPLHGVRFKKKVFSVKRERIIRKTATRINLFSST